MTSAKRGPPEKLQDTVGFNITVPVALNQYLEWLARHTMWGPTRQDVVEKILTRELNAMFVDGYHERKLPS